MGEAFSGRRWRGQVRRKRRSTKTHTSTTPRCACGESESDGLPKTRIDEFDTPDDDHRRVRYRPHDIPLLFENDNNKNNTTTTTARWWMCWKCRRPWGGVPLGKGRAMPWHDQTLVVFPHQDMPGMRWGRRVSRGWSPLQTPPPSVLLPPASEGNEQCRTPIHHSTANDVATHASVQAPSIPAARERDLACPRPGVGQQPRRVTPTQTICWQRHRFLFC